MLRTRQLLSAETVRVSAPYTHANDSLSPPDLTGNQTHRNSSHTLNFLKPPLALSMSCELPLRNIHPTSCPERA